MHIKNLFIAAIGLLFVAAMFSIVIDQGDAQPSDDDISGCSYDDPDREDENDCHNFDLSEGPDQEDAEVEASKYDANTPEKIVVTIKLNGDKWQGDRSAEASQKGNGDESDYVYDTFEDEPEGSYLDISKYVEDDYEGEDKIEDEEEITIWAAYEDEGVRHFNSVKYTYYKPNTPAVAVPLLSLDKELESEDDGTDYLITDLDADGTITVWFHSNFSYDEDEDDDVVRHLWDLDGDGDFAETGDDEGNGDTCPERFSRTYDQPGTYEYQFYCTDGNAEGESEIIEVTLKVNKPEERPDLAFADDVEIETKDGDDVFHKKDTIVLDFTVTNDGNANLENDLLIYVYAAYRATEEEDWDDWEELTDDDLIILYTEDQPLEDGSTELVSFDFITDDDNVDVGYYKFKVELDPDDDIEEYLEEKNQDEPNVIETDSIFLDEEDPGETGEPDFEFGEFNLPDRTEVENVVRITIEVINNGDGDGSYRLLLLVDGTEEQRTRRFTVVAGDTDEKVIQWIPLDEGTFDISIQLDYKGDIVKDTEDDGPDMGSIIVDPTGDDSDGDGLPDWWEEIWFDSIAQYIGSDDPDDDGYTNKEEFDGNTNPKDKKSLPGSGGGDDDDDDSPSFVLPLLAVAFGVVAVIYRRKH